MLVQFFKTIPYEFDEAAIVDGASYPRIILNIILPMSQPIIAVMVIFTFLNTWNDFMGPLLYLNNSKMYTLALGLKSLLSGYNSYWHILMAAATMRRRAAHHRLFHRPEILHRRFDHGRG